jgi:hypothetical protein
MPRTGCGRRRGAALIFAERRVAQLSQE